LTSRNAAAAAGVGFVHGASLRVSPHAVPALVSEELRQGPGPCLPVEGVYLAADTWRMVKKPEPPNLFWLTYRHPDGRAAGVVVIESVGLLHARLKASLAGADRELEFVSGH
jgi:hypothetical protein